jgi:mRNA deadenylase 3'-5' endonuclease subunit Ccr4
MFIGPLQGESAKHSSYASSSALVWWKRKERILKNLKEMSPAIICLQEISYTSLQHTFIPELSKVRVTPIIDSSSYSF